MTFFLLVVLYNSNGDIMRVFIAKKKLNIKYYLIIIFIISIILLNILINIILNHIDKEKLLNLIINNSGLKFTNDINSVFNEKKENAPLVYLYNTFQTDKYAYFQYNSYNIIPEITQVNYIIAEELKNYNINSIIETKSIAETLQDNDMDYTNTYKASRILMERARNNYPSLNYFFDIGISEDERKATTYIDSTNSLAKVLFIIGTDYDTYLDNKRFASILNELLVDINKNISRGISYRGGSDYEGIYNQDFSSNTLRIFLGGKENTIEEVNKTAKIFAKAISIYIKEDKNAKE